MVYITLKNPNNISYGEKYTVSGCFLLESATDSKVMQTLPTLPTNGERLQTVSNVGNLKTHYLHYLQSHAAKKPMHLQTHCLHCLHYPRPSLK